MGTLFAYSLGISMPIIVMYAMYKWLLSHKTFHRFNRIILLSIYFVAMAMVPLAQIVPSMVQICQGSVDVEVGNVVAKFIEDTKVVEASDVSILSILLDIYIVGVLFMTLKLMIALVRIALLIKRSEKINDYGCSLVLHNNDSIVPFSWGRWIFMNHIDYNDCRKFVIAHERSHLVAGHWIDLLIAETVIILNWFNPAVWLMRVELQDLHEYEADENVLKTNVINKEEYQLFLIKKTVGTRFAAIANSLNHSSLKKRITMMLSKKSSGKARMRAFALVPVAVLAMGVVNNQVVASTLSSVASTQVVVALSDKGSEKSPLNASEKMPQFPGGESELMKFIATNVNYPKDALKAGIEGSVIVRFVVSETGKVVNPIVLKGVSESLDAEALRIIRILPDFIPGESKGKKVAVNYTVPIVFKRSAEENVAKEIKAKAQSNVSSKMAEGTVVLKVAEKMPQFPDGNAALLKFIAENVKYPQSAMNSHIEGHVVVKFVIDATGKVTNPQVTRGVSDELDAEALRVISLLPNFIPGEKDGKPVAVEYILPVTFKL